MHDTNCPYCDAKIEINHDDGYGYQDGDVFNQECWSCRKTFTFTTSTVFHYDTAKAKCLNGGKHKYKPETTFPRYYTKMCCSMCDDKREPTPDERKKYQIPTLEV